MPLVAIGGMLMTASLAVRSSFASCMFIGTLALGLAAEAAPKRTFVCQQGNLVVTVLNQKTIRVVVDMPGSADGKFTMTMKQRGKGFHYVKDEYEVTVTDEQNSLTYSAPDFGTAHCNWEGY
jgi:hypothetical protein